MIYNKSGRARLIRNILPRKKNSSLILKIRINDPWRKFYSVCVVPKSLFQNLISLISLQFLDAPKKVEGGGGGGSRGVMCLRNICKIIFYNIRLLYLKAISRRASISSFRNAQLQSYIQTLNILFCSNNGQYQVNLFTMLIIPFFKLKKIMWSYE